MASHTKNSYSPTDAGPSNRLLILLQGELLNIQTQTAHVGRAKCVHIAHLVLGARLQACKC